MPPQNWADMIRRPAPAAGGGPPQNWADPVRGGPPPGQAPDLGSAIGDAFLSAGEDAVASALLPSNHADPDVRDRTDAAHADAAFTGILAAAVAAVTAIGAASIAATLGVAAPVVVGGIGSAAALIRASWAAMSYKEKARIWRGEFIK